MSNLAIEAINGLRDAKSHADTWNQWFTAGKKLKSKKTLTPEDFGFVKSGVVDKEIASLRAAIKALKGIDSGNYTLPKVNSLKLFVAAMNAGSKHGPNSAQAARATLAYASCLRTYEKRLKGDYDRFAGWQRSLGAEKAQATAIRDYAKALEQGFLAFAAAAPGDVDKASLFRISTQCGTAKVLAGALIDAQSAAISHVGKDMAKLATAIETNRSWIRMAETWTATPPSTETMKKNQKADRPKK